MENLIPEYIIISVVLPLWIFLIIMVGRFFSVYVNKLLINFLTLISSFFGILLSGYSLAIIKTPIIFSVPFLKINEFSVNLGLHIDKISLLLALLLFIVSFAVQIFSISYLKNEKKTYRFFALLNLFNFGMSALLFSPNLFQLYVFWELVGIVSYLLIGFDYTDSVKSTASKRVFLVNRVGDTALIAGIIAVSYFMFNYSGNLSFTELAFEDINVISTVLYAYTPVSIYFGICLLFILASMVKSAQFPFHIWLQDAMEAKLPVSALLHSATMVVAGVYLTIRLMPFYTLENNLMQIISIIGLITAIACSFIAILERHPKKVLAYSTSSNLGLMFFALGNGFVQPAVILLIAHALIKSVLFILLPQKENNSTNQVNLILFIISGLSLSGIMFSGFCAKELLYQNLASKTFTGLLLLSVIFTAIYITKLMISILKESDINQDYKPIETCAAMILVFVNIIFYEYLMTYMEISLSYPFYTAFFGIIFTIILYKLHLLSKINSKLPLVENICYKAFPFIYNKITNGLNTIETGIFSNGKPIITCSKAIVNLFNKIEENIMNKTLRQTVSTVKSISVRDLKLQSKNIQTYNAYAFIILTVIVTLVIIGHKIIMIQFY